jgi:hypothetical protein
LLHKSNSSPVSLAFPLSAKSWASKPDQTKPDQTS